MAWGRNARMKMPDTRAIARFTNGPAMAMRMSRAGSGLCWPRSSISVTPPMGSRMMERTATPLRRATRACPNSCSTTQPKMMTTSASPRTAPLVPMVTDWVNHTKISRETKVRWMRISTPNRRPAGTDQLLMAPHHPPLSFYTLWGERLKPLERGFQSHQRAWLTQKDADAVAGQRRHRRGPSLRAVCLTRLRIVSPVELALAITSQTRKCASNRSSC